MVDDINCIETYDCLPFDNEEVTADVLQEFIKSQSKNVFLFSSEYSNDDTGRLAEYNYLNNYWTAGRFVGEAIFNYNKIDYKITIKPRFGEKFLFRMLEEIFNIKISKSASDTSKNNDWLHYIKRIIAFIWLQKLANANLHGLPKIQITKKHQGSFIRGRLDMRNTIKSLHSSNEVVSIFREKEIDPIIAQIVFQANQILKSGFDIGKINIPDSAKQAINHVNSVVKNIIHITESDYNKIRYKDIYLSWKPLVDLSWDIIKRKNFSLKQDKSQNGYGFFIDMAEVWEQYLRTILKKNLLPFGWNYKNERQIAYEGYFFKRELIPDLIFQKGNQVVVWDAKYKRMKGRYFDVDRADFFQIHTYIQYQLNHKEVKSGGLLYPISSEPNFHNYSSPFLINESGYKMNFIIDGIQLSEKEENQNHSKAEKEFINRILISLNIME